MSTTDARVNNKKSFNQKLLAKKNLLRDKNRLAKKESELSTLVLKIELLTQEMNK